MGSRQTQKGFTIVELLLAVLILLPLFTIGMQAFVNCLQISNMSRNSSLAVTAVQNRLTDIENTDYNQIFNTYHNSTFTAYGLTGAGKVYVDNSAEDHLVVKLSFSWREQNGRVIGEDNNIDGVLNAGEDLDGNGQLDSIVTVTTQMYNI